MLKSPHRPLSTFAKLYILSPLSSFGWNGKGKSPQRDALNVSTLAKRLEFPGKPAVLRSCPEFPVTLRKIDGEKRPGNFPNRAPLIASVYAAVKSYGPTALDDISFVSPRRNILGLIMGTSKLEIKVQRVGKVVFLDRVAGFRENMGDLGRQFEQMLVESELHSEQFRTVNRLTVGTMNVLLTAEIDCVTPEGSLVELKLSSQKLEKAYYQCLLSGTTKVVCGVADKGEGGSRTISGLKEYEVGDLEMKYGEREGKRWDALGKSLEMLRSAELQEGKVYRAVVRRGELQEPVLCTEGGVQVMTEDAMKAAVEAACSLQPP